MKILDISYRDIHQRTSKFINNLLCMNIPNDYLFENNYFQIKIKSTDYACMLYRIMWEDMYLRRKEHMSKLIWNENNEIIINMSISEAIVFLHQALPPVLKKNIENELTSIDVIKNKLLEVLIDTHDTNQGEYYLSHFWQIMRFQTFDNPWTYDLTKVNKLMSISSESIVCQVVASTRNIKDMISDSANNKELCEAQLLFATKTHDDLLRIVCHTSDTFHALKILSIKFENGCYYVMTYYTDHDVSDRSVNENNINQIIKSSYEKIVK